MQLSDRVTVQKGSVDVTQCVCSPGYQAQQHIRLTNPRGTRVFPPEEFSTDISNFLTFSPVPVTDSVTGLRVLGLCRQCTPNRYSTGYNHEAGCIACQSPSRDSFDDKYWPTAAKNGRSSARFCVCPAAMYHDRLTCQVTPVPAVCTLGLFTSSNGSDHCHDACPPDKRYVENTSTHTVSCVCQHGTEKHVGAVSGCRPCEIGYFKDTDSDTTTCTRCRQYSTTMRTQSISAEQCLCDAQSVLDKNYVCVGCVAGEFQTTSGSFACVLCDAVLQHFISGPCVCPVGWTWNGRQCAACEAGKFKSDAGWSFCQTSYVVAGTDNPCTVTIS